MSDYFDYRFKFYRNNIESAVHALEALRKLGLRADGVLLPIDMLGLPLDANGNRVPEDDAVFFGQSPDDDPTVIYLHVRTGIDLTKTDFMPVRYGLLEVEATESESVLGRWFDE